MLLAEAVLAPGLTLPNGALIIASAPAKGAMPRYIVLAACLTEGTTRIREYATWEVAVHAGFPRDSVETYWGSYFPVGEIAEAVASFAKRTGTMADLVDAVGAHS